MMEMGAWKMTILVIHLRRHSQWFIGESSETWLYHGSHFLRALTIRVLLPWGTTVERCDTVIRGYMGLLWQESKRHVTAGCSYDQKGCDPAKSIYPQQR